MPKEDRQNERTGVLLPGTYGRYCCECDTYLPTGVDAKLATRYFEAVDAGDQVRAVELKLQLGECRRVTIDTAKESTT